MDWAVGPYFLARVGRGQEFWAIVIPDDKQGKILIVFF